ncbi:MULTISPECIES: hypothetical protein [unclassified Cedecea]|uniref:hypothetical protein n=1 Tax=unclassified Cedecea TaxID=2649846 RepID=UPI003015FA2F
MTVITHPGRRINELIEANYNLRRELVVTRQRLSSVQHLYDLAQKELSLKSYDITAIPPIPMTKQVLEWITEYGVPWEALYCPDCRSWFVELDNLFPYHLECCVCKCEQKELTNG